MKIKELLNPIWSLKMRIAIAYRILSCCKIVKHDIVTWKKTQTLPNRELCFSISGQDKATVSILNLVNLYGMDPLTAMLFFDDLIKANTAEDKTELLCLLSKLTCGRPSHKLAVSESMLDNIQTTQPGLWSEYQRLLTKNHIQQTEQTSGYADIIETEI